MLHVRPTLRLLRKPVAHQQFQPSRWNRNLLTLAIETSCDDTAVAILEKDDENPTSTNISHANQNGTTTPRKQAKARLIFNEKITAPNTGLGGIHPLEALNSHQANLSKLVAKAIRFLPDAKSPSLSPATSGSKAEPSHIQRTTTIEGEFGNTSRKSITKQLPDFISVTRGPGMRSNLHCGLDTAKGLSVAWSIPLLGVHHMQAHALTPRLVDALEADKSTSSAPPNDNITNKDIDQQQQPINFPFLTLLISGGHTLLLHSHTLTSHSILASTVDIAIGDALDKAGRLLLPDSIKSTTKDTAYAKHLSEFAFPDASTYELWPVPKRRADEIRKAENEWGWVMQTPFADTREMKFSFTGVESMVGKVMEKRGKGVRVEGNEREHEHEGQGNDSDLGVGMGLEERMALGRAAIGTAFEHLASRTIVALQSLQAAEQPISSLVVSGGVAANPFLRYFLRAMLDVRGFSHVRLIFPPPWLCTDNAAMIAWCGMEMYEAGFRSELGIGALRKWSMDGNAADGGILGVGGWNKADGS